MASRMTGNDTSKRDNAPGYLAALINREITRRIDLELRPLGITLTQLRPMFMVAHSGPTSQRDILAHSEVGQPAMVSMLAKLERLGLVERAAHPTDRRASLVVLTTAGRELVDAATPVIYRVNDQARKGLSVEERTTLAQLMQRVLANLIR